MKIYYRLLAAWKFKGENRNNTSDVLICLKSVARIFFKRCRLAKEKYTSLTIAGQYILNFSLHKIVCKIDLILKYFF